jgi:hypothetical protein
MIKRLTLLGVLIAGTLSAQVGLFPDFCQQGNTPKKTVPVTISSATTTAVITAVSGQFLHICEVVLNVVGTNPTLKFEYGTQASTACDTGAVAFTGAMPIATTTWYPPVALPNMSHFSTPGSQQFCIVTGGTVTGVIGYVTYVTTGG